MHEFFPFNFPLREYFFCTSPAPPPPISFLTVRPLWQLQLDKTQRDHVIMLVMS